MVGDGRLYVTYQGELVKVMRSEVGEYCDDWFYSCIDLYYRWKRFGLPFGGGPYDTPQHYIEIIENIDAAIEDYKRSRDK